MYIIRKYLLLYFIGFLPFFSYGFSTTITDTIPPSFTTLPQDITIACENNLEPSFLSWYLAKANSVADNGAADIIPTISQSVAIDSFNRILNSTCADIRLIRIGFFAQDSCNNVSQIESATFSIIDNTKPNFPQPAINKDIYCTASAHDSLQSWIDLYGGAIVTDNCSDSVTWKSYIWTDNLNNSGFSDFDVPTNIIIVRETCLWSVNVSFFAEDECGNDNVTTASFNIVGDSIPPFVSTSLMDTIISCDNNIPIDQPSFSDDCDSDLSISFIDISTKGLDSLSCNFYNYEIERTWTAIDACGNNINSKRKIIVVDTIAPIVEFEPVTVVDCDSDLELTSSFIIGNDNCSQVFFSYNDNILFNSNCQSQLERTWHYEDVCGNLDSIKQTIQIQDFEGPQFVSIPRDTTLLCDNADIKTSFDNWVKEYESTPVFDNCNTFKIKVLPQGDYLDTLSIVSTNKPDYQPDDCASVIIGEINTQLVTIVAYDICGNISQHTAKFSVIDTIPPTIIECPNNFNIQISDNECTADYNLATPEFIDNCLALDATEWSINIDLEDEILIKPGNRFITLSTGPHTIDYTLTDCGGNTSSCNQIITVIDNSPPEIMCPSDVVLFLKDENCLAEYIPEPILTYTDNCFGPADYRKTLPDSDGLITFTYNSQQDIYQASDFVLEFPDVTYDNILFKPNLKIAYRLNLDNNATIAIRAEDGSILHVIEEGNCINQEVIIELSKSRFINWASNEKVRFTILNLSNGSNGTIPCEPSMVTGIQDNDGTSYFKLELVYSDILATTALINNDNDTLQVPGLVEVESGIYNVIYTVSDAVNNLSSCLINLEVRDTISPIINCKDFEYEIDPLLFGFFPILETNLDIEYSDNCKIDSLYFSPREVACTDIGSNIEMTTFVQDEAGNISSCKNNINVKGVNLEPSFTSDLCFADTLKLFSNFPIDLGYEIKWTGPNNFTSTITNPVIIGINDESSGLYSLTATNQQGCVLEGEVNIEVTELKSPDILSDKDQICLGEELLINTNSFTEMVEYFWFEGISPNGTLIGQTSGPSLSFIPPQGTHFYYVEVKGQNCNSNPSNTLEVNVTFPPTAEIENPFITLCEGEDIVLTTNSFDPAYTYEWSGPNGYSSSGQFPNVISNINNNNQGNYTLLIKEDNCVSDTAIAQVVVFDLPNQPIITGEQIFCEGQTAVLTVPNIANGTRYIWYNNGVFYNSVASNSLLIPAINNNQSGEWTVQVEEGICISDTSEIFNISVESNLNIGATNNGPVCEGDEVLLTCSFIPDANYSWSDPFGNTFQGRIINVPAIAGNYTVTVTTISNCNATASTEVIVGVRPEITALSNTSLSCMNGNMPVSLVPSIFPPGNYTYNWSGPNGFMSLQEQPIINNFNEDNNGEYTLVISQNNCNSAPKSTIINITNTPPIATVNGNQNPCEGDDITLTVSNPLANPEAIWIWTTPFGQVETEEPFLLIENFEAGFSGSYSVIQEINNCRSEDSTELLIEFTTTLATPIISGQTTVCAGESLRLTINNITAENYFWFTPNGTITTQENSLTIPQTQIADSGTYSVRIRSGNCESETSELTTVQIIERPQAVSFNEEKLEICTINQSSLELCIANSNLDFELLKLIDIQTSTTIQETTENCFDLTFLLQNPEREYQLTAINFTENCSSFSIDTIEVSIYGALETKAEVDLDTIVICNQEFTTISADQLPINVTPRWSSTDPDINIFDAETKEASFSNLRIGHNEILLSSSNGICTDYAVDTIIVNVITNIEAMNDIYSVSYNEDIIISPTINDIFDNNIRLDIVTAPEEGELSITENMFNYKPPSGFVGTEIFSYRICYENCPDLCSIANIELTIGENVDCFAGNLITPNGDGKNDLFTVPCLVSNIYTGNELLIFNQWGDEIYNAAPYQNEWDGTYNGNPLPVGTYFYILDLGDGSKPLQGFLIIEL